MKPHYLFWDVIAPHQLPKDFDPYKQPVGYDFRNFGLKKDLVIVYGHKASTVYYRDFDFATKEYSYPIAKCDRSAEYDEKNLPFKLIKTVYWRLSNGKWTKGLSWDEPITDPLSFWQKRRARIVNQLKKLTVDFSTQDFPLETYLVTFFEQNQVLINSYIDAGSNQLMQTVENSSESWLDEVIEATGNKPRDVLLDYLSIGVNREIGNRK